MVHGHYGQNLQHQGITIAFMYLLIDGAERSHQDSSSSSCSRALQALRSVRRRFTEETKSEQ